MATTAKQVAPRQELERLLPTMPTRELYEFSLAVLEEAASRAANYALLVTDPLTAGSIGVEDALAEGTAMATRFNALYQSSPFDQSRRGRAAHRLWKAQEQLTSAWDPDGDDG